MKICISTFRTPDNATENNILLDFVYDYDSDQAAP
jgi:hypothetical protein